MEFVASTYGFPPECERLPFDLPEAEEELIAGYQTEYSAVAAAEAAIGPAIDVLTCVTRPCPTDVLEMIPWDGCKAKQIASAPRTEDCVGCKSYDRLRLLYLDEMGGMAIPMPKIFTIFTTLSMASLAYRA
ncbi:hypothetical protein V8G54_000215 (mitochondrion) [Vigna mungo]|uniref:NADH-ubiquinone oxidoreductase chain 1 n=1 Tax=Vigna mungo TaxID=3915 RepID=A0AAQ3SBY5_VIGMU